MCWCAARRWTRRLKPGSNVRGGGAFEDYPLDQWKAALDVNLTGLFLCAQAASKPMLAQDHGVMIFICSTYGLVGPDQRIYRKPGQEVQPYKPVYYSVTKAGVLGLTRYLATYYAGKNIRANALTPGGVYNNHDEVFTQELFGPHGAGAHGAQGRNERRAAVPGLGCLLLYDRLEPGGGWRLDGMVTQA